MVSEVFMFGSVYARTDGKSHTISSPQVSRAEVSQGLSTHSRKNLGEPALILKVAICHLIY